MDSVAGCHCFDLPILEFQIVNIVDNNDTVKQIHNFQTC